MNDRKDSQVTTGSFKVRHFNWRKPSKKKAILICLAVIILAATATILFFVFGNRHKPETTATCHDFGTTLTTYMNQQKYDELNKQADEYLQKNCPTKYKVSILQQKAVTALYQKKTDEAEKLYKQVEELNGGKLDPASAQALAGISYQKGDKQSAIKYYKALIQAVEESPDKFDNAYIPQYKRIIEKLETGKTQ